MFCGKEKNTFFVDEKLTVIRGENMVLKKEQSKKFHVVSLILAVLLISGGIISYSWLYKNNSYRFSYEKFMYMDICIELILLGTILVLINVKKDLVGKIVLVIFGFVIGGVLFNNLVRLGVILSVVTIEYSCAAEPPVRCGVSHLSRRIEPLYN